MTKSKSPSRSPEKQAEYKARYRAKPEVKAKERLSLYAYKKRRAMKIVQEIRDFKEARGCMDCGQALPWYVLDFDHRGEQPKRGNVSAMMHWNSRAAVFEEIAKCDVVCANCHRTRTFKRGYHKGRYASTT